MTYNVASGTLSLYTTTTTARCVLHVSIITHSVVGVSLPA